MKDLQPVVAATTRREALKGLLLGAAVTATLAGPATGHAESQGSAFAPPMTIINARIFDGQWVLDADSVAVENGRIAEVGKNIPRRGAVVDARGGTLLPGLVDSHAHPVTVEGLRVAALFGATTVLNMGGMWTPQTRKEAQANDQIADFEATLVGMSPPNGHPSELVHGFSTSNTVTADDARAYVKQSVDLGSDYIKITIENGEVFGAKLPALSEEAARAAVTAGHGYGKMVVAHAMTHGQAELALSAGVDGLVHLFLDGRATDRIVHEIARSRVFLVPCFVVNRSLIGRGDEQLGKDPRVAGKLSEFVRQNMAESYNLYPAGRFEDFLASVAALKDAGVDLLVGTDSSIASPDHRGGPTLGASVHRELQYFVQAGFTPIEALRAATSVPARRFDLRDRGRIMNGLRADLVLVDGDPTQDISSTLSIKKVWKKGVDIKGAAVA